MKKNPKIIYWEKSYKLANPDSNEIKCLKKDAEYLHNIIDQIGRVRKETDFIKPILSSTEHEIGVTLESIKNHMDNLRDGGYTLF